MKIIQKHLAIILWVAALVVMAGAVLYFESDLLWKVQQKNLFLNSSLFLKEQLVVPGGLLTWVSTWFTQFLYYPWLGMLMLCGWWLALMGIVKRAFELPCADPDYHRQFMRSYNIPEFMRGPVTIAPQSFADVLKGEGEPVKYVQKLSK